MTDRLVLGLDIGTSSVKALAVARSGDVVATASAPLTMTIPQPGWAEQAPPDWWAASQEVLGALMRELPAGSHVESIGVTGQMHSSVFLDREGRALGNALLWCDGRATAECREITARAGGEPALRRLVCNAALEGFTLPKILWLRNHEPDRFRRLAKVLLPKDYVRFRLTGAMATEPSDASGTLLYDPARLAWSDEMLDAMELPKSLLPDLGGSAECLGRVTPAVAAVTGLVAGTPVVGGGADNACGAAGVGAVAAGELVTSWGTSGTVLSVLAEPRVDPSLRTHTFCHVLPGAWYAMGVVLSAGAAFAWYRDTFAGGHGDGDEAARRLTAEAAAIAPGAAGLLFLPYLQGERTPHRDATARGAFLGLSLAHSRAHLTRAVLEGVCFALRDSLAVLRELGLSHDAMLLTGGAVRDPLVRRLLAEVFGVPVVAASREEGPAYGAALLAAVGAGLFPDLAHAVRATITRPDPETPDPGACRRYDELFARFQAAYPCAHGGETIGSFAAAAPPDGLRQQ